MSLPSCNTCFLLVPLPLVPSSITVQPYNGPWRRPSRWISPTPISPALPQAFFTSAPRFPLTSPSGTSQRLSIFTNRLTISPAPLVCYFLKPFFSQPWPLATGVRSWPISPAGPLSTRDQLLLYPFSLVFCLKIRLHPAVPLLFLFLPFPPIPLSALSRPCAYFSVAPPPGTTRISSLWTLCPMPPSWPAVLITGSFRQFWRPTWVTRSCGRMTCGNSPLVLIGLAGRTCPTLLNMVSGPLSIPFSIII